MKNFKTTLAVATMLCSGWVAPAIAQDAAQSEEAAPAPTDIIVTARRSEERLQDVPVAVSVITPERIDAKGTFNPVDLVQSTPGLNVTASVSQRTNLTYTIRGQGFSFGTIFPAVITYFNEVPIAKLTEGTFFDVANVQVLRGPQGVTFGRVTDGGNVMVAAQTPKNEFGGYVGAKVGDYGLRSVNGAINVPLVEDKVLLRLAFETTRRDGFTKNLFNGQDLDNVAYEGYRGGLTIRPVEGLENTTVVNYLNTHDNGTSVILAGINGNTGTLSPNIPVAPGVLTSATTNFTGLFAGGYGIDANGSIRPMSAGLTPFTAANYLNSLNGQLAAQNARGPRAVNLVDASFSKRKNLYVVNTTRADLTDDIQLTNIFGYVHEKEFQASNFAASNGNLILTCVSACPGGAGLPFNDTEQFSEELRISGKAIDGRLNWALGGYLDEQRPAGKFENATINVALLNRVGVSYSKTKSRALYGSLEFAVTDRLKLNGGLRYTHDTVENRQATYLAPIPGGEAALKAFLMGPFGGSLPSNIADQVVAATFAPIPHGECTSYGTGGVLGGATCITPPNGSFKSTTWSAGASYQTDGGQLFYAKISKGYRPGGVNGTAPAGVDPRYAPETDVSIEAGIKADFNFNGMFLRTNLAAFTDRYKDIQKNVVVPGPVPLSIVQNVNNARIKGVELEVTFIPVDGLTLGGTLAHTDAKFDSYNSSGVLSSGGFPADPCNPNNFFTVGFCSGNRFNSVPDWQYTLSLDYKLPLPEDIGQISFGGLLYHQSTVALTDTSKLNPASLEKPYTKLDLTANWRNVMGQPVDLGLFVTNVTNKLYRIGTNNLMQNSSVGVLGNIYAAPRMWGASVKYRFGGDAN
jgi:iron complex outermembrane receptor protein